ncbi:Mv-ORF120 peptide [Maruca vitrata nucleopolyhedrovirus]|uniref:Mv-ORF120 peptide n=1 Tax=Maruca vitrata nucleopolyhedrovirus TaxID=1307954 RepID=A1YRI2_9ABAC|nr:Mv-ORF120 peptide [Maruca vitrata nucleopolyhedrovirus]ABM05436.1 Mv-ORF120 peptide [Maruca vitrata nucleopolyhedrovirus]
MNFFVMQKKSRSPAPLYTVQSLQIVDYFIRIVYTVLYAPNILLHNQLFCITKKLNFACKLR